MKKITKTFYVSHYVVKQLEKSDPEKTQNGFECTLLNYAFDCKTFPVEITFFVPEKTISLSELEFDNLYGEIGLIGSSIYNSMKQKLFGESHD